MERIISTASRVLCGTWLALSLILVSAGACGGSSSQSADQKSTTAAPAAAGDTDEQDEEGTDKKDTSAWRWKGKRDNCFYLYENQCFEDRKAACAAAQCGEGQCRLDSGAPAKVSCKK